MIGVINLLCLTGGGFLLGMQFGWKAGVGAVLIAMYLFPGTKQ